MNCKYCEDKVLPPVPMGPKGELWPRICGACELRHPELKGAGAIICAETAHRWLEDNDAEWLKGLEAGVRIGRDLERRGVPE
jgi:hypothetical protein